MKKIFLSVVFLFAAGCTKTKCTIQTSLENGLSSAAVTQLQCQNIAKVKEDIDGVVAKLNLCPAPQKLQGTIADSVCPIVSQIAVAYLGAQVPLEWQCNPAMAQAGLASALGMLCKQIPY